MTLVHFNGICAGLVGLKNGNVENVLVLTGFLKGPSNHGYPQEQLRGSEPVTFGATLGSLWGHCGSLWVYEETLKSLGNHFGVALGIWSPF